MKSLSYISSIIMLSLSVSCTNTNKKQEQSVESIPETVQASIARDPRKIGPEKSKSQYQIEQNIYKINSTESPLYGYWVGAFGKNKINIALAYANNDSIYGHSVCAGNFRPIKGTIQYLENGVNVINMWEPGDDKYDGEFKFTIDTKAGKLTGTWKPYINTVSPKEYMLTKKTYKYNPNVGDFPAASVRYLEVPEVDNLLPEEIEMIRNEIYARHGYSFQNLKIRRIFDAKDWYIPMAIDIRDQLTEVEAQNIDMLYNYEDYYEEYYDDYGR